MSRRSIIAYLVSACLTISVFYVLFQEMTVVEVLDTLRAVDLYSLLAFVVLSLAMSTFRTWRYIVLLDVVGVRVSGMALFLIVLVRNFCSDLLPARLGTLIYVFLVTNRLGVSLPAALSSFAVAFLFDILALAVVLLVALLFIAVGASNLGSGVSYEALMVASIAVFLLTALILISLPALCSACRRSVGIVSPLMPKLAERIELRCVETADALHQIRVKGVYLRVILLSCLVRVCKYLSYIVFLYGLMHPLGFSFAELDAPRALLGIVAAEAAASLPISGIAGFGVYEGTWAFVFELLGYQQHIAKLTAVSHHLFTQVYGYGLGLIALGVLMFPISWWTKCSALQGSKVAGLKFYSRLLLLVCLIAAILGLLAGISGSAEQGANIVAAETPTVEELELQKGLGALLGAEVIFDSNRSGTFGIYALDPAVGEVRVVVDTPLSEMYPDPAPDGTSIVFARAKGTARRAPSEIWQIDRDGTQARELVDNGTFPTYSADGKFIFFERNRAEVVELELSTEAQRVIYPHGVKRHYQIVKPRVSPDGRYIAFTSDRGGRWNVWVFDRNTAELKHISQGCEPAWFSNSDKVAIIRNVDVRQGSGIFAIGHRKSGTMPLHDAGEPRGHEYFPTISTDDRFALWASCRAGEHSHITANYQLFVKELRTGRVARLTFDGFTNRWPKLLKSPL